MKNAMAPRPKKPDSKIKGIRPLVEFSEEEHWEIETERVRQRIDKGEYLRRAVLYCVRNKVDLQKG
ncbi:MAG: hypothetical protein JXA20_05535 [Spirochaetes bacterium]|nr:hypothetical protein [Spirochaetota bacterium]